MPFSKPLPPTNVREDLGKLIQEIGGEGVLLSLLQKFYERMSDDILIGFFFDGKDLNHIANMQMQFILNAAGLIKTYAGKGPSTAHLELAPILSGHFDRRLVVLREVLSEAKLTSDQVDRWISFENLFREMVVK